MKEYEGYVTLFYYVRDISNRPIVTVCILLQKDGQSFARGVAICSDKDNSSKNLGRELAVTRAFMALQKHKDLYPCFRKRPICFLRHAELPHFKAMFNPELTKYEAKILKKYEEGNEN